MRRVRRVRREGDIEWREGRKERKRKNEKRAVRSRSWSPTTLRTKRFHPAPTPRVTYYHAIYDATYIHTHTQTPSQRRKRRATTCSNRIDKHTRSTRALRSRLPAPGTRVLRLSSSVKATPTKQANKLTTTITDSSAKVQTRAVIATRWLLPSRAIDGWLYSSSVGASFCFSPSHLILSGYSMVVFEKASAVLRHYSIIILHYCS